MKTISSTFLTLTFDFSFNKKTKKVFFYLILHQILQDGALARAGPCKRIEKTHYTLFHNDDNDNDKQDDKTRYHRCSYSSSSSSSSLLSFDFL